MTKRRWQRPRLAGVGYRKRPRIMVAARKVDFHWRRFAIKDALAKAVEVELRQFVPYAVVNDAAAGGRVNLNPVPIVDDRSKRK